MAEGLSGAILGLFDVSRIRIKAEDVAGLKEALAAQSEQIAALQADLSAANAQIAALANAVTPMANEIAGKASASAVGALNTRVGRIEGDADGIMRVKDEIRSLSADAVAALGSRVSQCEAEGLLRITASPLIVDAAVSHAMSPSAISSPQTAADLADDLRAGLEKLAAWLQDGIAPDDKITAKAETVTQLTAGLPPVVGHELIVLPMDLWRLSVENGVILLGAWGTVSTDDLYLRHWVKLETSDLSDDLPRLHDLECRLVDVVNPHSA